MTNLIKVYTPDRQPMRWDTYGAQKVISSFTDNKSLILRLAAREIRARYKGSVFGVAWALLLPVIMLAIYTFIFTVVFEARWNQNVSSRAEFTLALFAGLIVFNFFSESVSRAPSLLVENTAYISKVVFPLESLCWVPILVSIFNAAVSAITLLVFYSFVNGLPPLTVFWLPIVFIPFVFFVYGVMLILAPLGLFLPDFRQIVPPILSVLTFASPVFYPASALPPTLRSIVSLSPITFTIEQFRRALLEHSQPNLFGSLIFALIGFLCAWLGYIFFAITKRGFADVI